MENTIIFIYCLAEDFLKALGHKEDPQTKMYDAEVITFALVAAFFFHGNYERTRLFFSDQNHFGYLLEKSRLNKRLLRIDHELWLQILVLCRVLLQNGDFQEYIVDSFPVPVCQNARITSCKLLRGKKFHGFCASKNIYFFGLKVHVLTLANGFPVEVIFTPGAESDMRAFRRLNLDIGTGSIIYGDKAYTDYSYEDILGDVGITLCTHRKKNAKRQHSYQLSHIQKYRRKRIETSFSSIARLMPRWIHAVTMRGFELKVMLFVLAFALQYVME